MSYSCPVCRSDNTASVPLVLSRGTGAQLSDQLSPPVCAESSQNIKGISLWFLTFAVLFGGVCTEMMGGLFFNDNSLYKQFRNYPKAVLSYQISLAKYKKGEARYSSEEKTFDIARARFKKQRQVIIDWCQNNRNAFYQNRETSPRYKELMPSCDVLLGSMQGGRINTPEALQSAFNAKQPREPVLSFPKPAMPKNPSNEFYSRIKSVVGIGGASIVLLVASFFSYRYYKRLNADNYRNHQIALNNWQKSFICMRCGKLFIP